MLAKISSLESVLNLESIGLFLNEFDVTGAYLGVFSEGQLSRILDAACKRKPYNAYRKYLRSHHRSVHDRYIQKYPGRDDETRLARFRKFKFYEGGNPMNKLLLQIFLDLLIAKPLVSFGHERSAEDQKTRPKQPWEIVPEQVSVILYEALKSFYYRVSEYTFGEYNNCSFEELKALCDSPAFREAVTEQRKESAFALYLLGHLDPRIHFLSLHFVQRDAQAVFDSFPFSGQAVEEHTEREEQLLEKITTIIHRGNRILSHEQLDAGAHFQPKGELLGPLFERTFRLLGYQTSLFAEQETAYKERIAGLEKRVNIQEENHRAAQEETVALQQRVAALQDQIRELEKREPKFDPDEKYRELQSRYEELERELQKVREERGKLERKVDMLRQGYEGAKGRNQQLSSIIDEKQKHSKELEARVSQLEADVQHYKLEPTLKQHYGSKSVLVIVGIDRAAEAYETNLERVFSYVEVVKHDEVQKSNPNEYDLILMTTGATRHPDRWWIEKTRGKPVIVYPGRANMVLQFLYDRLPRNAKSG